MPFGHTGNIGWAAEHPGTITTSDGGAKEVEGHHVAAGAAVLWDHEAAGTWSPCSTYTATLPYHADSQIAEVYGAFMSLKLLEESGSEGAGSASAGTSLG